MQMLTLPSAQPFLSKTAIPPTAAEGACAGLGCAVLDKLA